MTRRVRRFSRTEPGFEAILLRTAFHKQINSAMTDYIVTNITYRDREYTAAALIEDQKLSELVMEPRRETSLVGNVYCGVVSSVSANISGAFVETEKNMLCFLPLKRHSHIRPSQKVLVQVTKDAAGRKEPVLTEEIRISGKGAVLMMEPGAPLYSRKLSEVQKQIIGSWLGEEEHSFRVLVRTNAAKLEKAAFLNELKELEQDMGSIAARFPGASKGEILWQQRPFYLSMLRDLYQLPDRCFSNIPSAAAELEADIKQCFIEENDGTGEGTEIFRPDAGHALSLPELYNLPHELDRLIRKQVFLKSGAFLVIEQTEAFVSIDVNTGKCLKGRIPEETYRKVNLEAAAEIARQMRLRNLSGMILVDFITLTNEDHKEELLNVMRKLVKKDHVHTEAVDLTPLGIMEILRQKVRKPLAEILGV